MGRLGLPLRAGRGRGASLFAFGRPRVAAQGVLCGAEPAVHDRQELSRPACCGRRRSQRIARYFWHVAALVAGRGKDGGISAGRPLGGAAAVAGDPGARRGVVSFAGAARGAATHSSHAANQLQPSFGRCSSGIRSPSARWLRCDSDDQAAADPDSGVQRRRRGRRRGRRGARRRAGNADSGGGRLFRGRHAQPGAQRRRARCWPCRIILAWAAACKPDIVWRTNWVTTT